MLQYTQNIEYAVLSTCSSNALDPGFGRKQTSESSVASEALETKSKHAIAPSQHKHHHHHATPCAVSWKLRM